MDLWIRSQAKDELVKCSRIKIEEGFETNQDCITRSYYTIYNFDGVHINWLGEYNTKERAMEVLDEIQKLLMGQDIMIFHNIGLDYDGLKSLYKKAQEDRWIGLYSSNIDSEKIEYISPNCIVYEMPKE